MEIFLSATLIFARISAISIMLPGLSSSFVPIRYRLCISALLSLTLAPILMSSISISIQETKWYFKTLVWELFIGAFLGFCIRIFIFVLQITGAIIAQSISLSQILGANVSTSAGSSVSNILTLSGITLLMISGFLELVLYGASRSYTSFPAMIAPDASHLYKILTVFLKRAFEVSFQLAAPFLLLAIFYNSILAIVNRAMPQLLVSFIGVPAILLIAMPLMEFSFEPLLSQWYQHTLELLNILTL